MLKEMSFAGCILAAAGVAMADGKNLDTREVLFDNGQVAYEGVLVTNNDLITPAAVIYDNGGENYSNGNEFCQWLQAEDFVLANDGTVGGASFGVLTFGGIAMWDGTVEWSIYADAGGTPGSLIASGNGTNISMTFDQNAGFDFYDCTMDLDSPTALSAGTTYWFGLHMNNNACLSRDDMYWSTTNPNGTTTGNEANNCGTAWFNNGQEHSFQLLGAADCLTLTVSRLVAGGRATWDVSGATAGEQVAVVYGNNPGSTVVNGFAGYCASFGIKGVNQNKVICRKAADGGGNVSCAKTVPSGASGVRVLSQAAERNTCPKECMSNLDDQVVQ
jgi:hypothetical protein